MPNNTINLQIPSASPKSAKGPDAPTFESSGLPESYRPLWDSNPFVNYHYQLGFWDKIGNVLGFRTSEDRTREEYAQRSNEYISQLQSLAREEEYNSEAEQSKRQREAGLNPALNGVNPSQASEMNESPMTLPDIARNNGDDVTSAFGTFSNIISTVIGLGSGLLSLQGQRNNNVLSRLSGVKDIYSFGKELGLDLSNESDVNSLFGVPGNGLKTTEFLQSRLRKMGFSRRDAKRFAVSFNQGLSYRDSLKGSKELLNDYNELSSSTKRFYSNLGQGVNGTNIQKYTQETLGIISQYELDVMRLQTKYQKDYYKTVSGILQGGAENAQNKITKETNEQLSKAGYAKIRAEYEVTMSNYQKDLAKLQQNVFNKIDNSHPILKTLALSGLSGLQSIVSNPLQLITAVKPNPPKITNNYNNLEF